MRGLRKRGEEDKVGKFTAKVTATLTQQNSPSSSSRRFSSTNFPQSNKQSSCFPTTQFSYKLDFFDVQKFCFKQTGCTPIWTVTSREVNKVHNRHFSNLNLARYWMLLQCFNLITPNQPRTQVLLYCIITLFSYYI